MAVPKTSATRCRVGRKGFLYLNHCVGYVEITRVLSSPKKDVGMGLFV